VLNLDPAKLLIIAVVAVLLLGPDKLPQVARQVGGAWRTFNEFRHRMETEVRNSIPDLPPSHEIARLARSPSALLTHLSNMGPGTDDADQLSSDGAIAAAAASAASPDLSIYPSTNESADQAAATPTAQVIVPGDPSLN